ncbi:MAG: hypothetical protein WDA22_17325 [Bacteroidota bacterium]
MKIVVIGILSILWCCSPIPRCPEGSRIILRGEYPTFSTPDSLQWSIVSYSDFDNHCWNSKIGYVGSYGEYHLFRFWTKILPAIDAEYQFATHRTNWSPNKEYLYKIKGVSNSVDSVDTK